MELPLTELKDGETGTITSMKSGEWQTERGGHRLRKGHRHKWGFERRLADMGLTPGTKVTVVKSAPLNGPLEVLVRGSRLALGRGIAVRVYVEVKR